MARIKFHPALAQVSGAIGNLVLKHTADGPIMVRKGTRRRPWSAAQVDRRQKMKLAGYFYRAQMKEAERDIHYRARAKAAGMPVSAFVIGGYLKYGAQFAVMETPSASPEGQLSGRDAVDVE